MRILFITSDYSKPENGSNIYTDLAEALNLHNHAIKVVVAEEKKKTPKTKLNVENGIPVLRVKTGNLYEVSLVEKAITFLTISRALKKGINDFFGNENFDLILFQSPPLTMYKVVKWAMKKYNAPSYLMMKDIFPQNGVDIGLYSKHSPIYWYFRRKEKELYKISTKIGCMSNANIDYIYNHNKFLKKEKFEVFPNTVKIGKINEMDYDTYKNIRNKYGIKENDVVAIFGGNFGRPQGLDFLLQVIDEYKNNDKVKFLLIGRGTEKNRIFNTIKENQYKNVWTYDFIPRDDYENLTKVCDIGLIFLDSRFTIPNYPSKTLSYFECSLPIMAAIDKNTDYSKMLEDAECGFWVVNGDIKNFKNKFDKLIGNKKLRREMGKNGRKYYEKNCNVDLSVKKLEKFIGEK